MEKKGGAGRKETLHERSRPLQLLFLTYFGVSRARNHDIRIVESFAKYVDEFGPRVLRFIAKLILAADIIESQYRAETGHTALTASMLEHLVVLDR